MEEFKRIWLEFSLTAFEAGIRSRLPWDTGDSRPLLWLSVVAFIVVALIAARMFGAVGSLVVWCPRDNAQPISFNSQR